jgi:hypothetical protein
MSEEARNGFAEVDNICKIIQMWFGFSLRIARKPLKVDGNEK